MTHPTTVAFGCALATALTGSIAVAQDAPETPPSTSDVPLHHPPRHEVPSGAQPDQVPLDQASLAEAPAHDAMTVRGGAPPVANGPPLQVTMDAPSCSAQCPPHPPPGPPPPPPPGIEASPYLSRIDYVEGLPPPEGYEIDTEVRRGLVIAGAVVTGTPWIASVTAATALDGTDGAMLAVPVVGPWLAMATLHEDSAARAALTLSGLTQASGATMLLLGLAMPRKSYVRYVSPEVVIAAAPLPGGAAVEVVY